MTKPSRTMLCRDEILKIETWAFQNSLWTVNQASASSFGSDRESLSGKFWLC